MSIAKKTQAPIERNRLKLAVAIRLLVVASMYGELGFVPHPNQHFALGPEPHPACRPAMPMPEATFLLIRGRCRVRNAHAD